MADAVECGLPQHADVQVGVAWNSHREAEVKWHYSQGPESTSFKPSACLMNMYLWIQDYT